MKTKILLLSMAFMLVSGQWLQAQKQIQLSYQLKKGQKYVLEIKNNQTINMSMSGQSMVLKQNLNMQQNVLVSDVDDANKQTLELTYENILFKQNAMGMEVIWDSQNPDTINPISKQIGLSLGGMINNPIVIVIDEKGNPISLNKDEGLNNQTNLAGFESGMMVVYPTEKISVGSTWSTSLKPDPKSDFVIESTYTLDELKGNAAMISFSGTIKGTEIMGEKALINGTITGKTEVDTRNGWVTKAAVNQELQMEMEQAGMKIPMKMNSFIELNTK